MRIFISSLVLALASLTVVAHADTKSKQKPKDQWIDGVVTYKVPGVDTHFTDPAEACKAEVDDLAKHGNKKTYVSVKEGTSSTMMTCNLKESDGSPFEQQNIITKVLECPATSTARSTDNSGDFAKIKCHCDTDKCPAPATPPKK
jgi:hypothetical protein